MLGNHWSFKWIAFAGTVGAFVGLVAGIIFGVWAGMKSGLVAFVLVGGVEALGFLAGSSEKE